MNVLLVYTTNSGSTYHAARLISAVLRRRGNTVDIRSAPQVTLTELNAPGALILGTPSWNTTQGEGQPPIAMQDFLASHESLSLTGKPSAVMGCGDSNYTKFCGAVEIVENFLTARGARLVAPALKIDGFYFNLELNQRAIESWAESLSAALKSLST